VDTHGWENRGDAFVKSAAEAHRCLQGGTEIGGHTRRKKMYWANDEAYGNAVDLAGLLMQALGVQAFGDIGN
jgi:hypothetical protein